MQSQDTTLLVNVIVASSKKKKGHIKGALCSFGEEILIRTRF